MRLPLLAMLIWALSACATPGLVQQSAPDLHRGAVAAAAQAEQSFAAANAAGRAADVERLLMAAEQPGTALPTIADDQFTLLVEPETTARWQRLFAAITGYTGSLIALTDPALAATTGDDLQAAGEAFNALAGGGEQGGQLAAAAGTLGAAIVSAAGERRAEAVMRRTDPAFHDLLTAMGETLGATNDQGLRGTVASTWNNAILQVRRTRYGELPRGPDATPARRALLDDYLAQLAARDAALADLANLRQSLIALAEAHRAITLQRPADARPWLDRIDRLASDLAADLAPR